MDLNIRLVGLLHDHTWVLIDHFEPQPSRLHFEPNSDTDIIFQQAGVHTVGKVKLMTYSRVTN